MIFDCIKAFTVSHVDDNGFQIENSSERVQKGSMWEQEKSKTTLTGADLRLTDLTGLRWIEISSERLTSHFKEIKI